MIKAIIKTFIDVFYSMFVDSVIICECGFGDIYEYILEANVCSASLLSECVSRMKLLSVWWITQ
jgi:hypothetical protein